MSELAYDIEQLYIEGYNPKSIASQLDCPLELVYNWIETNGCDVEAEIPEIESYNMDEVFSPFSTSNS
jgi:uncharacterized protein YjcR